MSHGEFHAIQSRSANSTCMRGGLNLHPPKAHPPYITFCPCTPREKKLGIREKQSKTKIPQTYRLCSAFSMHLRWFYLSLSNCVSYFPHPSLLLNTLEKTFKAWSGALRWPRADATPLHGQDLPRGTVVLPACQKKIPLNLLAM